MEVTISPATQQLLQSHLDRIRIPLPGDKIYKDECVFSFDTPECETGLYVCLNTFLGFGIKHVERVFRKTGNAVYLHLRRIKREILHDDNVASSTKEAKKPVRLALGIEGGFDGGANRRYEYEETNSLVVLPQFLTIPLPNPHLPDLVQSSVAAVLTADAANKVEEAQALSGTWEGEKRAVTKHAETLVQLENGVKIPPRGWKCLCCDKTENLWLNLTDGSILCGRRFFDGSGGNNHAMQHYAQTGYPLVVKLGTITPSGADVFSYDEDDMVEDPQLAKHLAHFGINVTQMEKTDKSMIELEIDMNQRIGEWAIIQESESKLRPLYGPGYTGMVNLGNSCYMNSVMQVLFSIPDFQKKYFEGAEDIFENAPPNPTQDFNIQMAKLATGLLSGDYSKPPSSENADEMHPGIRANMFKNLIGKGHPEFSTKRQQDAQEFLLHLINVTERNCCRGGGQETNPAECFKFEVEEKIECVESRKVKYTARTDYMLSLPIPLDAAVNKEEVAKFKAEKAARETAGEKMNPNDTVRPVIPMSACLDAFAAPETVEDFYSTALEAKSLALKTTRLRTFPDYLFFQLKKFEIGDDWVPKKLNVSVKVPDELDLSFLRGSGLQPGEEELPDAKPEPPVEQEAEFEFDSAVLDQLSDMGFPSEACKKAIYHTMNSGIEPAMNWIMEHMGDPDFATPFTPLSANRAKGRSSDDEFVPDAEALSMIESMGFGREQACKALKATDNNVERAAEWLFSHPEEMDTTTTSDMSGNDGDRSSSAYSARTLGLRDGLEKYSLVAFISHMGASTMVGHYVCHVLREGHWVIYNDEKVALSEHPPKDLAYLYLYRRSDAATT